MSRSRIHRKLLFALGVFGAPILLIVASVWLFDGLTKESEAETVHNYTLEIMPKDIEYGNGAVWHAWTFNGTVPGPTLNVKAGELLRVTVINRHDMVHSFHSHLDGYSFENDGSQANIVTGVGEHGILAPGAQHTWEFRPPTPGIYYYHTHSSDKGFSPAQVVRQGLYGAIVVQDPTEPPIREEVLFMGEIGHDTEGRVAPFIMNGMGIPGGEVELENIYHQEGFLGLTQQFDKTIPLFRAKVGETIRLHVINIGDLQHSLYIHSATVVSEGVLGGRPWPARVLPLVPGSADTLLVTFDNPGLWLFHCHVETHADAGMLGLFEVEGAGFTIETHP